MREHNLMGVPAFIIGEESFAGLDVERLEQLIDYNIETCSECGQMLRIPKNKGTILVTCSNCEYKFKVQT